MTNKIEWGGSPGPWHVSEDAFRAYVMFHDEEYGRDFPVDSALMDERPINLRAMKEVPAMVEELRKFAAIPYAAFQFHHQQQRVRAILARIDNQEGKN